MTAEQIKSLAVQMREDINVLNMFCDAGHPCFEDLDFYCEAISMYPNALALMLKEDAEVLMRYANKLEEIGRASHE